MKKKLLIIALAAFVLCGGLFAWAYLAKPFYKGDLSGTAEEYSVEGREIKPMYVDENGEFVILQLTDTHLVTGRETKLLAAIEKQVARVCPGLVVVSGDMLDGQNLRIFRDKRAALRAIADVFEHREQPWVYVPGNNDGEVLGSSADVAAYLARHYEYCLVANEPGLTGAVQFTIPLLYEEGETAHELIFMDSLGRDPATNYITYDCMKQDQADWLRGRLQDLKTQAPLARASVFFHADTPALCTAQNQGAPYADGYAMPSLSKPSVPGNWIIDSAMQSAGNVGLVSVGHLHPPVNWCAYLDKTYYHVTRASGAAVITIHTDDGNPRRLYSFEELGF